MPAIALIAGSGVYYETAAFTFPTTEGTLAVVTRLDDDTARQNFCHTVFPPDVGLSWQAQNAGDPIEFFRQGATYASAGANIADFNSATYSPYAAPVAGVGVWCSVIATWSAANTWLYLGRVGGPPPQEPSAYQLRSAIVTPNTTAAPLRGMNSTVNTTRNTRGPMAALAIANRVWTPEERQQFNHLRLVSGCSLFHYIGANGTVNVPDASGNGWTGTFTGTPTTAARPRVPSSPLALPLKPRPFAPGGRTR